MIQQPSDGFSRLAGNFAAVSVFGTKPEFCGDTTKFGVGISFN
jgi:hypothetical protein